jgi:hypothetical protein
MTYYFIFPFYVFLTRDGYVLGNGSDLYLQSVEQIERFPVPASNRDVSEKTNSSSVAKPSNTNTAHFNPL